MKINKKQAEAILKYAKRYADLEVQPSGPLLRLRFYVQSASSSGYTYLYLNRNGDKVDV